MSTPSDARIEELIERSSLGSEGARQLRARTTEDQLDRIRRLAHAPAEAAEAAMLLPPRAPEYEDHAFGAPVRVAASSIRPQAPHGPTARSADPPMSASSAAQGGPTSYDQLDDHELLRLHVAGNPDSFGYLVKRHRDRMWAVAIRTLGEPEEAADALQEAFISAFRRADSFRGDAKVTTWLHRIVVNACLDRIRRRQVRAADPLPEDEDRTSSLAGPAEDDPAEVRERRRDVLNALKQVNADQRNALVLVDLEGYSIEEAAAILGCAPGTVKSRCARGRARLIPLLRHWRTTRQADDRPDADTESTPIPPTPSAP